MLCWDENNKGSEELTNKTYTCVEGTRVERANVRPFARPFCPGNLRTAYRPRDGSRHGRITGAQAYVGSKLEMGAAIPAPGVGVVSLNVVSSDVVVPGNESTVISFLDRVAHAGAIWVFLWNEVGRRARRTAYGLSHCESRAKRRGGVMLREVCGRDATSGCQTGTRIARLDEYV